jgi:transcriptional regulator with XRE-family HTH domain
MSNHPWGRYREQAGFTQSEVAELTGNTRHYIIRLEQGLFWHPPDSLLVRLAGLYKIDLGTFEASYYEYVRETRSRFAKEYESFSGYFGILPRPYNKIEHPLVRYRLANNLSRAGLCKGLCLHYGLISDYEANKQRDLPEQLQEACDEIKWDTTALVNAVAEWRKSGRADSAA